MVSVLLQLQPLIDTAVQFLSPALTSVAQFTELFRGDNALDEDLFDEPETDAESTGTGHELTRVTFLSQLRSTVKRMSHVDTRMQHSAPHFTSATCLTLVEQYMSLLGPALYSAQRYVEHLQRSTTSDYFKYLANLTVTCTHSTATVAHRSKTMLREACSALFLVLCFKETQSRILLFNRALKRALLTKGVLQTEVSDPSRALLEWFEHAWRFAPTSIEIFYQMHRLRLDIAIRADLATPETLALAHSLRYNPPAKKKKAASTGGDEVIELTDEQSQSRVDTDLTNHALVENVVLAYKHCIDMLKFHTHIDLALARLYHDLPEMRDDKLALEIVRPLFNAEKLKTTNKARKKQLLTAPFCRIYITPDMDALHRPHKTIATDRKAMRLLVSLAGQQHDSSLLTIICTRTEHEKLLEDLRVAALQRAVDVSTAMTLVRGETDAWTGVEQRSGGRARASARGD
jgi:hypothetical protein